MTGFISRVRMIAKIAVDAVAKVILIIYPIKNALDLPYTSET